MTDLFEEKPEWLKKAQGQAVASCNHSIMIKIAREEAIKLAIMNGETNIDEVREVLIIKGYDLSGRFNWLGSVFRAKEFVASGYKQADHVNSHARIIRTWKLYK